MNKHNENLIELELILKQLFSKMGRKITLVSIDVTVGNDKRLMHASMHKKFNAQAPL